MILGNSSSRTFTSTLNTAETTIPASLPPLKNLDASTEVKPIFAYSNDDDNLDFVEMNGAFSDHCIRNVHFAIIRFRMHNIHSILAGSMIVAFLLYSESIHDLKAGDKIPVSRENLVGFIQNAYDKINSVNRKNHWIADSFKTCGLDPWSENTKRDFEAHLEKLSESRVYQALIDQHTAVQLTTCFGELTLKDK